MVFAGQRQNGCRITAVVSWDSMRVGGSVLAVLRCLSTDSAHVSLCVLHQDTTVKNLNAVCAAIPKSCLASSVFFIEMNILKVCSVQS